MIVSLHINSLLTLGGVAVALTLSLILYFFHQGNRPANKCLSFILFVSSILALLNVFLNEEVISLSVLYASYSLQFLIGPIFYFYTRLMIQSDYQWKKEQLWHLLPMILSFTVWQYQSYYSGNTIQVRNCLWVMEDCSVLYQGRFIHRVAAITLVLIYSVASLSFLKTHQNVIKNSYSAIEEVNLNWLKVIISITLAYALCGMILEVYINITGLQNWTPVARTSIFSSAPLIMSLFIGYFGLLQRKIVLDNGPTELFSEQLPLPNKKYQTSSLTEDRAKIIWKNLQEYMTKEKPYLQASLKIADLADSLHIATNHLSETINGYANQSFYEFINIYRIDEAKRLLRDNSSNYLSVTDIGFQSGFNSNSTFFSHFKKHQMQTPREYRKVHKTDSSTI